MNIIRNQVYRINVAAGEKVLIRRYKIVNGSRSYANIAKIDSDGNLVLLGEIQSNQSYL